MDQYDRDDDLGSFASLVAQRGKRWGLLAGVALLGLIVLNGSYFITSENEVSSVLRMGALARGPLSPGPHVKIPFFESVYTMMISKRNYAISDVTGKTSNNQRVTFEDLNVTWHIAPQDANRAMFKVGGLGNSDIAENFVPVVRDRALRVLGRYTTVDINQKKAQIANDIQVEAGPSVHDMFGITIDSIQLPKVTYDPAFEASVAAAVMRQNDTLAAEATLRTIRITAEQQKATAEGAASAQIAKADADAQQAVLTADAAAKALSLNADAQAHAIEVTARAQAGATQITAEANANALKLAGDASGEALRAKVSAVGGSGPYVQSLVADAMGRWTTGVPQIVLGDRGPMTYMPLPMPTLAAPAVTAR